MVRIRIYTENKNYYDVLNRCKAMFTSFTIIKSTGFYRGYKEASLIIEIIIKMNEKVNNDIVHLSKWICCRNEREEVLVTVEDVGVTRIGQSGILESEGVNGKDVK